jgi:hypothetical protein
MASRAASDTVGDQQVGRRCGGRSPASLASPAGGCAVPNLVVKTRPDSCHGDPAAAHSDARRSANVRSASIHRRGRARVRRMGAGGRVLGEDLAEYASRVRGLLVVVAQCVGTGGEGLLEGPAAPARPCGLTDRQPLPSAACGLHLCRLAETRRGGIRGPTGVEPASQVRPLWPHRGSVEVQFPSPGVVPHKVEGAGAGWIVTEPGTSPIHYDDSDMRISILWKAQVHPGPESDAPLTPELVTEIISADLTQRGVQARGRMPFLSDQDWLGVVHSTYYVPVSAATPTTTLS